MGVDVDGLAEKRFFGDGFVRVLLPPICSCAGREGEGLSMLMERARRRTRGREGSGACSCSLASHCAAPPDKGEACGATHACGRVRVSEGLSVRARRGHLCFKRPLGLQPPLTFPRRL